MSMASASDANPCEDEKITEGWVLREVEGILRDSRNDRDHRPALRAVELLGRSIGLWDHQQKQRLDEEELALKVVGNSPPEAA